MCDVCQISAACRIEYETENDQTWLFSLCKLTNVRNSHISGACECLKLTIFTLKTWKIYDVCHIFIACRIRYETRITTWCCRFYSVNQETNVRCLSHFCCVPKLQNHVARALTFSSYIWRRCIAAVPKFKLEKS